MDLIINFGQTIADGARYDLESFETNLEKAMSDNFNTPSAMGRFFTIINSSNVDIQNKKLDANEAKKLKTWLITKSDIFGIIPKIVSILPLEIQNLSDQRQKLKEKNNYEEADKIRIQIEEMGYRVEDTIYGPLITLLHN